MESKDKLSALKNDFDVWRSKREKGTPVPNALKERACQLLEHCKISHIARSCNVSATLVRTWKKILNQDDPKNNPKSVTFIPVLLYWEPSAKVWNWYYLRIIPSFVKK